MSNDLNEWERYAKLIAMVGKLVIDGKRTPTEVSDALQAIIEKQTEKFTLLADLGIITVPKGYIHGAALSKFKEKNEKKFFFYNDAITDANFPKPTRVLKAGDVLHVRAYLQTVAGYTNSAERLDFLRSKQAILTGAQGAALVFEQKRHLLPKSKWYSSMDEENRLWKDAGGRARVPDVDARSGGGFGFSLGDFAFGWGAVSVLLCFSDF